MTERQARAALKQMGYRLRKDTSVSILDAKHSGCYQIVNTKFNRIEAGEHYDLTLEDVIKFIKE